MIIFPQIDKILFSIGPLKIHWYGVSYFVGILIAIFLASRINNKNRIFQNKENFDLFFLGIVGSLILGGRLGHVLIYNLGYYLQNPLEIFMPWRGGMAFHGALIGIIVFLIYFSKKYKINFLKLTDLLCFISTPGIFLGRIANFINQELKGRFVENQDFLFGVVFPNEEFPRHPSQIYEAIFEGLIPFLILFCLNLKFKFFSKKNPGFLTGFFLIFYGFSRFVIEKFWRLPDPNSGYVFFEKFTIGQGFCFTMLIVGLYILIFKWKKKYDCIL